MIKKKSNKNYTQSTSSESVTVLAELPQEHADSYKVQPLDVMPVLPLRNMILFPGIVLPVTVGRDSSLKAAQTAYNKNLHMIVVGQKKSDVERPEFDDLYHIGVVAKVLKIFELPNGVTTIILHADGPKVKLLEASYIRSGFMRGQVEEIHEEEVDETAPEIIALTESLKEAIEKYVSTQEVENQGAPSFNMEGEENASFFTNFFCSTVPMAISNRFQLLEKNNMGDRRLLFLEIINQHLQFIKLKNDINEHVNDELTRQQREYFLQQQIKYMQSELNNGRGSDAAQLRKKAEKMKWAPSVAKLFEEEVQKLEIIGTSSSEYSTQLNYLQTLLRLPWNCYTKDNTTITQATRILNHDHYGLEKVKERILEHLAVLHLKRNMKSPILCLYGPPGVGKTSLGRSIASALGRKYVRMSLGGVNDEAEIRGHRRTYIGAMPGRIINSLIKAGSSNPVIILDEIDKMGIGTHGDPSAAMLEVLDPEQNATFHDNFIDMDYDLSKVMFIATANNIGAIPAPLLDRMELVEVSGYITEEKIEIARRHLIPKELESAGLDETSVTFSKPVIEFIIENYTRESGVRELEKKIGKILRKKALEYVRSGEKGKRALSQKDVREYLGAPEYSRDKYQGNDYAGVVTGLAWTAVGGEILFVETSLSQGKGGKLTLTGNLGDVMKESAMLALEYLKAHTHLLELPEGIFDNWNIHIHVPEGAIPKDGPSAGITMVTSLASALTQRKVKSNLAMTGEITLRGKVLPVGGIKEKILAAKRAGIKEIILCQDNRKDIGEINPLYLEGLTFHYVSDIKEVLDLALTNERVKDAIDFTFTEPTTPNEEKK